MNARRELLETLQLAIGRTPLGEGAYARAPSVEHRAAVARLLGEGVGAFEREHYAPGHFTASVFLLSPAADELLLIRHRKLGLWLQPGGHVEPADVDLTATALRELREETGVTECEVLEPFFDLDVHTIPAWSSVPAHLHHDLRVLARAHERRATIGDEVDDVAWFSLDRLADDDGPLGAGFGTDESVRRVARHLRTFAAGERRVTT